MCDYGGVEKIVMQGYSNSCFLSLGFDCDIEVIPGKWEGVKGHFLKVQFLAGVGLNRCHSLGYGHFLGGIVVQNIEKGFRAVFIDYGVHKVESTLGYEFIKRKDAVI